MKELEDSLEHVHRRLSSGSVSPARGPAKPGPAQQRSLEQLLNEVTEENIHGETGTGSAVGSEVW